MSLLLLVGIEAVSCIYVPRQIDVLSELKLKYNVTFALSLSVLIIESKTILHKTVIFVPFTLCIVGIGYISE